MPLACILRFLAFREEAFVFFGKARCVDPTVELVLESGPGGWQGL